jgi:hypothetical protein
VHQHKIQPHLAEKDEQMVVDTELQTYDALTTLNIPSRFDVTYWPKNLKNYLRHLILEVSGYWDKIIVPELTIAEPQYRVGDRGAMRIFSGKEAVEGFYRETFEAKINVMGARTMNMCVEDFGVTTEAAWTHVAPGQYLRAEHGFDANPTAHYLMNHRIFQIFSYTKDAKLIGERIYDDAASYSYEELAPSDVVTPEMAREQLAPLLDRATLD